MKNPFLLLIMLFITFLFILPSCNNVGDDASAGQSDDSSAVDNVQPVPEGDHSSWTFLTNGYLINKNTVRVNRDPRENPNKGHWINLKPDGTYEYGMYDKISYTGVWSYHHPGGNLDLMPNDEKVKKSQWNIKWNEETVIFVGTDTYGDNHTQIQYIRKQEKPTPEG